jgi:hypothetical protein
MTTKLNVRTLLLFSTIFPAVFVSLGTGVYYTGNELYQQRSTNRPNLWPMIVPPWAGLAATVHPKKLSLARS